ncbi:MAG TPA: cation-translocating P-type ATPase, partial [Devosia sp.]|nr:cation-translocating P-type ATPase [Devosia sp.]
GLTSEQARSVLRIEGPNTLPEPERRSGLRIAVEVLREPMLALLVISGIIYLVLGELGDALILVVFALFSVVVTVVQEIRTERVLQSLRDLTSPVALVIRDGVAMRIPGREVVRGDAIVLREGDRVPADALVLQGAELEADESLLTGESVPVRKRTASPAGEASVDPGGDDTPWVYSGTLIVRGSGLGEVVATGSASQIGRIGRSLADVHAAPPRLQSETRRLTLAFGLLGGGVSVLATLLYGWLRGNWLTAVLAGIALGMSMLPEEFPVVLTVFLAMGAWRISRARVLTRRASAIEALGSATVLCTDKTGTLTENRMVIAEMRLPSGDTWTSSAGGGPGAPWRPLLQTGVLASARDPFDPMERAIHALAGALQGAVDADWKIVRTYGLSAELLAVVQAWQVPGRSEAAIAAKGAPEAIAVLCGLEGEALDRLHAMVDDMAERGLRVLGFASAGHALPDWPSTPRGFRFSFLGLVGFSDPLRAGVPDAVAQCRAAGIRVVMITGDHPRTARAIAAAAGLDHRNVLTGRDLDAMDDTAMAGAIASTSVFARIRPEQKLRIVDALKRSGEVVAMTGDGVNDAPSLKAADIGVAMGSRGTDVAREASAIVLLDDDFTSIVSAIRLGRRIYDNLRKAMGFILAVHVPIAGLGLLPLLTGLPILFWPVHIAFLEMIIDPVCSLVFEAEREEADIMRRPPRRPDEPLLPWRVILVGAVQGLVVLLVTATIFLVALAGGAAETQARALTVLALVGSILALIVVNRTFATSLIAALVKPNRALLVVVALVAVVLAIAFALPPATRLFGFARIGGGGFALAGAAVLATLGLGELSKLVSMRLIGSRPVEERGAAPGGSGPPAI